MQPSIKSWLRLLSPTDPDGGVAGRLLTGLRHLLTGSVLLGLVITFWIGVLLVIGAAWQLLQQERIGAVLVAVLSGAGTAAAGTLVRRWERGRYARGLDGRR